VRSAVWEVVWEIAVAVISRDETLFVGHWSSST
jgi:hypothetical protein